MGSTVTQVACGRRHVLCRVGDRILACGYGARGQLGCPHMAFALVPTPVVFTPNDESPVGITLRFSIHIVVKNIFITWDANECGKHQPGYCEWMLISVDISLFIILPSLLVKVMICTCVNMIYLWMCHIWWRNENPDLD